ncbi:prefoldin subunit beta [archaeon]|jgi:prefoldin beta subunit|nr:prefoldin subunit beta [archaeon]MBT4417429.1 prefoldin subunit beta [archaeon]
MEIPQETQEKIGQLQLFEQNLQNFAAQKQQLQSQLLEAENATKELETASGTVYKIVGNIMVTSDKDKLKQDLQSQKELVELRLKNIKKQEDSIKEKAETIQAEVLKEFEAKKDE